MLLRRKGLRVTQDLHDTDSIVCTANSPYNEMMEGRLRDPVCAQSFNSLLWQLGHGGSAEADARYRVTL